MKRLKQNKNQGQILMELLIALLIFSFVFLALVFSLSNLLVSTVRTRIRLRANRYAQEAMEVVYNLTVNTSDWDGFVAQYAGDTWHPRIQVGNLGLDSGVQPLEDGKFQQRITLEKAQRDNDGNIQDGGPVEDENTLKAVSTVTWEQGSIDEQVKYTTYLINPYD